MKLNPGTQSNRGKTKAYSEVSMTHPWVFGEARPGLVQAVLTHTGSTPSRTTKKCHEKNFPSSTHTYLLATCTGCFPSLGLRDLARVQLAAKCHRASWSLFLAFIRGITRPVCFLTWMKRWQAALGHSGPQSPGISHLYSQVLAVAKETKSEHDSQPRPLW